MLKTYSQLYINTRKTLRDAGIEAYPLEARLLICHAAEKSMEKLMQDMPLYSSTQVEKKLSALIARRLQGEPVAYITGSWEFYGLPLVITPDVLIPRNDTEVLVEKALDIIKSVRSDARVLDLCTGSGCIGCAIAKHMPASRVTLVDISVPALNIARQNIRLNDLSARAVCMECDVLGSPPVRLGNFDLIVSNPPYIKTEEIETLDASVREYEPFHALDGGGDGLIFYREILKKWKSLLRPYGHIVFEVGEDQAADVMALMRENGFKNVSTAKDTAGIDRVVFGRI